MHAQEATYRSFAVSFNAKVNGLGKKKPLFVQSSSFAYSGGCSKRDSVEFDQIKVEDGFGYTEFLEIDEIIPETMSCGRQWIERFKGVDQVEESAVFVSTF